MPNGQTPDEETPLVSVILPTRDRPRLLALALSYYGYQSYPRRELIVVDDGEFFPANREAVEAVEGRLIRVPPGTPWAPSSTQGLNTPRAPCARRWMTTTGTLPRSWRE